MGKNSTKKKLVIIGAGFAGFEFASKLKGDYYDVTLLDKNNYYQFQPLMYQVATCGLEQSSISYPLRKAFSSKKDLHIRVCEVLSVDTTNKVVRTNKEDVSYDILVVGMGCSTNFFGNKEIEANTFQLKSVSGALLLRNKILSSLENAVFLKDKECLKRSLTFAIVGGGATGVELSGALADMKQTSLPREYPDIDFDNMEIHLIDGADRLLKAMSEKASTIAEKTLTKRGVILHQKAHVTSYDGYTLKMDNGTELQTENLFWMAGVVANKLSGIEDECFEKSRLVVDEFNQVKNLHDVYAIGDGSLMITDQYPKGHPQLGSVAMQMGRNLAKNMNLKAKGKTMKPFEYFDRGTMATIGRSAAVADIRKFHFGGFFAWIAWLGIHLILLTGFRNKISALWNWMWKYITYDTSLMYMIRPEKNKIYED